MTKIENILAHIKSQIGIELEQDLSLGENKKHNGKRYFNVDIGERADDYSRKMHQILRIAGPDRAIKAIEPNGVCRIAIYY